MIRYFLYAVLTWIAAVLPRSFASKVGYGIGYLFSYGASKKLQMMERRMSRVLGPNTSPQLIRKKARRAFGYWGRYWVDRLWIRAHGLRNLHAAISVEGREYLESAHQLQKGVIAIGPHIGNWEVGGAWYAKETGQQLLVLTEDYTNSWVAKAMEQFQRATGLVAVEDEGVKTFRRFLRHLRAQGIVGLLVDRRLKGEGTIVSFFGEQTKLPLKGVVRLASISGAPIIPAALYYDKNWFKLVFLEPIVPQDQGETTSDLVKALEKLIIRAPEQWHSAEPLFPSERA